MDTFVALGDTTDLTEEEAAAGMARFEAAMGSPVDMGRAGSALVDLGNKGCATESEILDAAVRIAASTRDATGVLALASAVASMGDQSLLFDLLDETTKSAATAWDENVVLEDEYRRRQAVASI